MKMTADQAAEAVTPDLMGVDIQEFLTERIKITPEVNQDLFSSGLVTSLFALELVAFIEKKYGIEINGADLKLNNFRTIGAMISLVRRIRAKEHDE